MNKRADYIKGAEQDSEHIWQYIRSHYRADSEESGKRFIEKIKQQKFIKDEERRQRVENLYYVGLCKIARVHGGRVQLDINEEFYYASLTYIGKELIFDRSDFLELLRFMNVLQNADTFTASVSGEYLVLEFTFALHKRVP